MLDLRGSLPVLVSAMALSMAPVFAASPRAITMDDRIAAQRAIEEVYWRHRIWPKENPGSKPALDAVMPASALRARVDDYLAKSEALDALWRRPITADQLQAELDRIARDSRDRNTLREIFDALRNDPFLIAETLARQTLADRLLRNWQGGGESNASFDTWWAGNRASIPKDDGVAIAGRVFTLPMLDPGACTTDTWSPTAMDVPDARQSHVAVWTGAEMIVWGGDRGGLALMTGGRYNPATDAWISTSLGANVPLLGPLSTAVWTGTEMIVWGGQYTDQIHGTTTYMNAGARYDPASDTWAPTSTGKSVPAGRALHTAVWTGTSMIVWGGRGRVDGSLTRFDSGGRYDPATDTWSPTALDSTTPKAREEHSAVWTGTRMIIWGGSGIDIGNTGSLYDPVSDTWTPTSTGSNAPAARSGHLGLWTGGVMIVWGGGSSSSGALNTGGRYDPATDTWQPTSVATGVPPGGDFEVGVWTGSRMIVSNGTGASYDPIADSWSALAPGPVNGFGHSAVWTGSEMIVWGGSQGSNPTNAGFRYSPAHDSWVPTRTLQAAPAAARGAAAVWTGSEMIVWGGFYGLSGGIYLNSGGRYRPATDSWTPTSMGAGVPLPREGAAAVWTGREMFVWGGNSSESGGSYDPLTDSWRQPSTVNAPANRTGMTAVWTGTEVVVWGGYRGDPNTYYNVGARYDPRADVWRATSTGANVPAGRTSHVALWTGTEMLVWGGGTASGWTRTGGRYDPDTDTWVATSVGANVPTARVDATAVWTGHEMIIWGGCCWTNTGGRYVPISDSWQPTSIGAAVPAPRADNVAVWTGSRMIVFGGTDPSVYPRPSGGALYDPSIDTWLPMTDWFYTGSSSVLGSAVWTGTSMAVWGGYPPTAQGALYCACPSGALFYRDADGDGYGDPGSTAPSCDGIAPSGYVSDATDCNDAAASAHPGGAEVCNGIDDNCDGLVDEAGSSVDADGDMVAGACDNCPLVANSTQSDFDHDGEGDACDLNDGEIWQGRDDKTSVSWQAEQGPMSWNLYIGDLDVLRSTGVYTQAPGSNPLADRQCQLASTIATDTNDPAPGKASYTLVTGVTGGLEGSLGASSSGPRPNANPCP